MKRDLLAELHRGEVSADEADNILSALLASDEAPQTAEVLGMTNVEWTANAHGVSFEEIARWRYGRWPDVCPVCGEKIDIDSFGWFAGQTDDDGNSYLVHIHCLPDRGADNDENEEPTGAQNTPGNF